MKKQLFDNQNLENKDYQQIWDLAEPHLKQCRDQDLLHTRVVVRLMGQIIEGEGLQNKADILIPAAILHDIGWARMDPESHTRKSAKDRKAHMEHGAEMAREILNEIKYPEDKIEQICQIVKVHDNRYLDLPVEGKLVKRLVEADDLWILTKECFDFQGEKLGFSPRSLLDLHRKHLEKLGSINSSTAKKIKGELLGKREKEVLFSSPVLITGGASGIGKALSEVLVAHGNRQVVTLDINPTDQEGVEHIRSDVCDKEKMVQAFKKLKEPIEYLVPGAGITQTKSGQVSKKERAKIMAADFQGVVNTFEALVEANKLSSQATIVIISSGMILRKEPIMVDYAEVKRKILDWALEAQKKYPKMRFLVLLPGAVDTPLLWKDIEIWEKKEGKKIGPFEKFSSQEFAEELIAIIADVEQCPPGAVVKMYPDEIKLLDDWRPQM